MIAIIDYGLGNIKAFANVYKRLNIPCTIASTPTAILDATRLILPGVGAFDEAMSLLKQSGLTEALTEKVIGQKTPVMGICVGMQGKLPGLGWIPGVVKKFDTSAIPYKTKLPHMGWNTVTSKPSSPLFLDIAINGRFYFLHSYYYECSDSTHILASTEYGTIFTSAVQNSHILGVQFHPEKSHHNGVQLLKNFATSNLI
jgi:glutamine amidotransferase